MTVGGVEMLGGLGVVADEVETVEIAAALTVVGNARDKGGEELNVFVGNVSVAVGVTVSDFIASNGTAPTPILCSR